MITDKTIREVRTNFNTGIEYEIALFRCLLTKDNEARVIDNAIRGRSDALTIFSKIHSTSVDAIFRELKRRSLTLVDVSFETQNDEVGPSDIVMDVRSENGALSQIGISVKYSNTCTLNATGRKFLSEIQIANLREKLPAYTDEFIAEMTRKYGAVGDWFRRKKPSQTTDRYIDLIRDEVIKNWEGKSIEERKCVLMEAYQETSPIPYWVYTYTRNSYELNAEPYKLAVDDVPQVVLKKYKTSYIGFYLRGQMIGKMQVKFNNGFVERCKKDHPDRVVGGMKMSFGQPFSSWNFSLV